MPIEQSALMVSEWSRFAICAYLIAEQRAGATLRELAQLRINGRSGVEEIELVSEAVSELVDEGLVGARKEGTVILL